VDCQEQAKGRKDQKLVHGSTPSIQRSNVATIFATVNVTKVTGSSISGNGSQCSKMCWPSRIAVAGLAKWLAQVGPSGDLPPSPSTPKSPGQKSLKQSELQAPRMDCSGFFFMAVQR
jgi:hypothetical protein